MMAMVIIKKYLLVFLLGLNWLVMTAVQAGAETWILVDTRQKTLTVMEGDHPLEVFTDISLGSRGAGLKRREGDHITPLGVFRVGRLNESSRFDLFIGLDYPNLEYAERAYQEKTIDIVTYYRIRRALEAGRTPPQDTPLGGFIGIHGIGAGDPAIHADFNWTQGCIALNNNQIRRLTRWVQVGTRVDIR